MARYSYSRWDGTQVGSGLGADDALAELTDELLYHGDLDHALRRLLQRGFEERDGRRVAGLRELLEQVRRRRQELLEAHQVGSPLEELARQLGEILERERAALDEAYRKAQEEGNERLAEAAAESGLRLDLLPADLAGRIRELQSYEWSDEPARRSFAELVDRLRSEVLSAHFERMRSGLSELSAEALQRNREMMDALNRVLEERAAGRDTDRMFEELMERYGDMFPGDPQTLDELLAELARQMAAMSQLLASMSPEQRAELQSLSDALLEDMDLRWQMERLAANLRGAFPQIGWDRARGFEGTGDPLGLGQAAETMNRLVELDALEAIISGADHREALAEIDLERVAQLLDEDAAGSLERLARVARVLEDAGFAERRDGRLELTPRGSRAIGRNTLDDLFRALSRDRRGLHALDAVGVGHERTYETKAYEWGDPWQLSIERTVRNAVGRRGAGTPVGLSPEDFEVERTESLTRTATVLALDLSLSMEFRGNFLAAKKVAMALQALISGQYPTDYLGLVGFGEKARELAPAELPEVSWDYSYGTNLQHALLLARRMLAHQSGTKQVLVITDGEPTAHLREDGEVLFNYPPVRETLERTVAEVLRCTRERITINAFVLDATPELRRFAERLAELNHGRAFFATPESLGEYVLVDFLDHRRAERRRSA